MSREDGLNRYFSGRGPLAWTGHAVLGSLLFLLDWAGVTYHRYGLRVLAWGPPRQLAAIWWHLPAFLAMSFLAKVRMESGRQERERREDQRLRDAKEDSPITLGLSPADDHAEPTNKSA